MSQRERTGGLEQLVLGTLERWRKREFGFGFAGIAFLAAFGVRYGLDAWLPAGLPLSPSSQQ
ncbi:MAG: hypothetical protein M3N35_06000 [Candidatus Binatota bacterium]|nr:hypothetical protein [Candidatus Binatota bacterium]